MRQLIKDEVGATIIAQANQVQLTTQEETGVAPPKMVGPNVRELEVPESYLTMEEDAERHIEKLV